LALDERATGPFERARTLLVLGEVQRRNRRRGAARRALRAALTIFEALGALLWAQRARRSLTRIEQRGTAGMTETDLRIMELVAAGQTNRQVAAALFMSPHTVDTHLRRIYRTLGVSSRTQLARHASAGAIGSGSKLEIGG
jgi:DNA-binding CsgD family transcriptional regulator